MNLFASLDRPVSLATAALLSCVTLTLGLIPTLAFAQTSQSDLEYTDVGWESQQITDQFFAEGSAVGDLNGDGVNDLVYGPVWYEGPAYQTRHELAEANVVSVMAYSQHFFSHVCDVNADENPDVISVGFPGRQATLYINPGEKTASQSDQFWPAHTIAPRVSNESPAWVDLIPGGLPELVCARDRAYGYYTADSMDDPTQPWQWVAISEPGTAFEPFGHGLGVGDIDGDGKQDIIDRQHWWRQPESALTDSTDTADPTGGNDKPGSLSRLVAAVLRCTFTTSTETATPIWSRPKMPMGTAWTGSSKLAPVNSLSIKSVANRQCKTHTGTQHRKCMRWKQSMSTEMGGVISSPENATTPMEAKTSVDCRLLWSFGSAM